MSTRRLLSNYNIANEYAEKLNIAAEQLISISSQEVDGTNQTIKDLCNGLYNRMTILLGSYQSASQRDTERIQKVASRLDELDAGIKEDITRPIIIGGSI